MVCGDEVDGDEADELWFSESCGARPCGVCKEEGARELPETRAPRRNERRCSLAGTEYHVHQALTCIWLVKVHTRIRVRDSHIEALTQ